MKFTQRLQIISENVKALFTQDMVQIGERQVREMMQQEFGSGWMDRIMAVKGKLNPTTVEQIITNASSRVSGKLGPLYELQYYISKDPRISGMLDKRVGAVKRTMWELQPGNKDNAQSMEATEFLDSYLRDIRFKTFLKQAMDGVLFGATGFQNVIIQTGDKYVFDDPTNHQISQSRWWQERSGDSNWGELYIKTRNGDKRFIKDPNDIHPARLSTFIYEPKKGYYDTTGLMYRVMKMYVLKVWTLHFLAQLVERHGKPFVYSKLSEKNFNDPEFKGTVARVLKQFGAERWGVFPDGFDIESLDSASSAGASMHENLLNFANIEMAIAILGQNLSTEVQGGSFAAAASHADVEDDLTEDDVEWLEEQLNDHFLYWLTRINYPEMPRDDYPKISLTPRKTIDIQKVAAGFKSLTELVDVPEEEIRSRTQVRAPRKKENPEEGATGQALYDEPVVGPSTRNRARNLDALLNNIGT